MTSTAQFNSQMDRAPEPENGPFECDECDGDMVLYDGDKVCEECGLLCGSADEEEISEWTQWRQHRDENYSGWYGEERVKMVGGFIGPWITDDGLAV